MSCSKAAMDGARENASISNRPLSRLVWLRETAVVLTMMDLRSLVSAWFTVALARG